MRTRRRRAPVCLLLTVLLGALVPTASVGSAPAADIDGNTYTSPTFGYTITWGDAWFVIAEESNDGLDYLGLTNATTAAVFVGIPDSGGATACLSWLAVGLSASGVMEDPAPLRDGDGAVIRGTDGPHAFAAYSGTLTREDGTAMEMAAYLDCQPMVSGESLLSLVAVMPIETFDGQLPLVRALLAGVVLPGGDQATAPDITTSSVDIGDDSGPGEPAPVFVSRRWRVAVAATVRDQEIEAAGLEANPGKDWLVVVADVTNWSEDDGVFAGEDLGIAFAGDDRRFAVAPSSSDAVAQTLELEVDDLAAGIEIEAGETVRLALVFQVPRGQQGPRLHGLMSEPGLPLNDDGVADGLAEIRPPVAPPALEAVEVVAAIDGEVVELRLGGESEPVRARLIGVDAPAKDGCFAEWSTLQLSALAYRRTWIERDPTERGSVTEKVYLWTELPGGQRILVNQQQVADGYAEARPLDEETRFAAWIGEAGRSAQARRAGLWRDCQQPPSAETETERLPGVTATTEPADSPTPTIEALPDEVKIETSTSATAPSE
jgi:endonuclease YncB( thermonuclease family)